MSNVIKFARALHALGAASALGAPVQGLSASAVQSRLKALGFNVAVDGKIGPQTQNAVWALQDAVGLPTTQEVDADTWRLMQSASPSDVATAAGDFNAMDAIRPQPVSTSKPTQGAAPTGASRLPPVLAQAKDFLLAPGQPIYKKPIVYVGAAAVLLMVLAASRKQAAPQLPAAT